MIVDTYRGGTKRVATVVVEDPLLSEEAAMEENALEVLVGTARENKSVFQLDNRLIVVIHQFAAAMKMCFGFFFVS